MSHLDEGTLHALLDGELEMSEMAEIQAHLGSCAACGSRLREVKQFLMEADRLVAEVQVETRGRAPIEPPRRERQPEASPFREAPDPWEGAPVLLIPDNPDPGEFGRRWLKRLAWAASLLVIVGAGYLGLQMQRGGAAPYLSDGAPVASKPEAAPAPASSTLAATGSDSARAGAAAGKPAKPSTPPPARAGALQKTAAQVPKPSTRTKKDENRGEENADTRTDKLAQTAQDSEGKEVAPAETESRDNVAQEAAEAMAELDRERVRERAAAATAALDSTAARRRAQPRQPATAPPGPVNASANDSNEPPVTLIPAVRTPEQRAQIYLRIGLDEASRQLGSPVHVIEGMSPIFMGLSQGRLSAGADTARPVVRVVYQDSQGRLIFLDQQRVRSGQTAAPAPTGEPAWILGETRLHLHGEVGPSVLQRIRPRVR